MLPEFKAKDEVYISSLKQLGTVVGRPKAGVYEVLVGGVRVKVPGSDLRPREALSKSILKTLKNIAKPTAGAGKTRPPSTPRIDLHGMIVEDAMREVEKAIDRAVISGADRMEILHGIGTGRIRTALHAYLSKLSVVERYKMDDHNPGVTWVYF